MAISSTTLRRRLCAKSVVSGSTKVAPSCRATTPPPPRSADILYSEQAPMTPTTSTLFQNSTPIVPGWRPWPDAPNTSISTKSRAATMHTTASTNSTSMRLVCARARSCWAKKFISALRRRQPEPGSGKRNLDRLLHVRRFHFPRRGRREIEHVGDDRAREHFALVVVVHHAVVVGLAREGDLVFGRGELF